MFGNIITHNIKQYWWQYIWMHFFPMSHMVS